MTTLRTSFTLLLWLAAVLLARGEPNAVRVVSQTVGTDELLLALAEPSQIAALSHLSRESVYCAVADEAKNYPQLSPTCDLEGVLQFHPTLILCANYSRIELVTQARRAGLRVIVFEKYRTIEDAYENLRLLARELGPAAEARAERIITDCERRIADLHKRLEGAKLVRVIAPSTYGMIPGDDSTFQDLCDHAGAENLAFTLGKLHGHEAPPNEQMLAWPVDRVVLSGDNAEQALAVFRQIPPYQFMPAVKEGRVALLKHYQLSCVTHYRIAGYEQLARALHPERFP
jgi:iron complex transport system substrate-binding protein